MTIASDQIVGLVSYGTPAHQVFGEMREIKHLYVDPSVRGTGLGRILMSGAIAQIQDSGFDGAGLAVVDKNKPVRDFYAKLGWKQYDVREADLCCVIGTLIASESMSACRCRKRIRRAWRENLMRVS